MNTVRVMLAALVALIGSAAHADQEFPSRARWMAAFISGDVLATATAPLR